MKVDTGRMGDDELIARSVLDAIEAMEQYIAALRLVYLTNLYEDSWGPKMTEHYERCTKVLSELREWELCPMLPESLKKNAQ